MYEIIIHIRLASVKGGGAIKTVWHETDMETAFWSKKHPDFTILVNKQYNFLR